MAANESAWLEFAVLCETLASTRSKLAKRAAIAEYGEQPGRFSSHPSR